MRRGRNNWRKGLRQYDSEVLKRLPYWVREALRMMEEIKVEKEKSKSGSGATKLVDTDS